MEVVVMYTLLVAAN